MPISERLAKRVKEEGKILWDFGDHIGYEYQLKGAKRPKIFVCLRGYRVGKEGLPESTCEVCYTEDQFKKMAEDIDLLFQEYSLSHVQGIHH